MVAILVVFGLGTYLWFAQLDSTLNWQQIYHRAERFGDNCQWANVAAEMHSEARESHLQLQSGAMPYRGKFDPQTPRGEFLYTVC